MTDEFQATMRRATEMVRSGDPHGATALIQSALRQPGRTRAASSPPPESPPSSTPRTSVPPVPSRTKGAPAAGKGASDGEEVRDHHGTDTSRRRHAERAPAREPHLKRSLGETLRRLREMRRPSETGIPPQRRQSRPTPPRPSSGQFLSRTFTSVHGARDYRLYVPETGGAAPVGLIMMLHGCTQDADDFAAGTGMNAVAAAHGILVAYPEQPRHANAMSCWNWFDRNHQERARGEPALLVALADILADEFAVPDDALYVAGLSAGGAMAAVLGATYPDRFAAIGVHSGLAYRSASDVVSAYAAMRGDGAAPSPGRGTHRPPRLIAFHGDADKTVSAENAYDLFEPWAAASDGADHTSVRTTGRRPATVRRVYDGKRAADGASEEALAELWIIDGLGHAWSGGTRDGSYTDPAGPNASERMVAFFRQST